MSLTELITFKVTKEIKAKMQKFDNINWSAWVRAQILKRIEELETLEKISDKNFCPKCGKRLFSQNDTFCGSCGAPIKP